MTTVIQRCHFLTRELRNSLFLNTRVLYIGLTALSLAGCSSISQTDLCTPSLVDAYSKVEKCETPHTLSLAAASNQKKNFNKNVFDKALNQKEKQDAKLEESSKLEILIKEIAQIHSNKIGCRASGLNKKSFEKLFTALIKRESGFNTNAISPNGAKGLGQFMQALARELRFRDPFQARANLNGSVRYLTRKLTEFKSVDNALAA
ncbi:lytic transglycosylase domain-containing protein [uncultured Roseibium sp.]|uniref:lytic transglycosylase domain-containing protein n=1 Tax=uncultured Roseibium sp. TaxID=1936171 RepID=UPI002635F3CC|nr:lytic transglycosylase domain-containing protein [uncultured Roseibium sp.]